MAYETERLKFRHWTSEDAEECFALAKDPHVGPPCGWIPHVEIDETRQILREILINNHTYCIIEKSTGRIIGNIGIDEVHDPNYEAKGYERELGFWMGYPYWNRGYMTEAVLGTIEYCFDVLGVDTLWCGHFVENEASRRVQEKCGFQYEYTYRAYFSQLQEVREVRQSSIKSDNWRMKCQTK